MTYQIITDKQVIKAEIGQKQAENDDVFFAVFDGDQRVSLESVATVKGIFGLTGTPYEVAAAYIDILENPPAPVPTLEEKNRADIDYLAIMTGVDLT